MKSIKYKVPFVIIFFALLLISVSVIHAQSNYSVQDIENSFDQIQNQVDRQSNALIVDEPGIQISAKQFVFYRANLEMLNQFRERKVDINDKELIEEMIKRELTVQYAKQIGLTVSPQEVTDVINREKAMFETNDRDANNQLVREIMKNRIRITGLSVGEFYRSEDTRTEYEKAIYQSKLFNELASKGEVANTSDFEKFKGQLLKNSIDQIEISMAAVH